MMKTPLSPRTSASPWAYAAFGALVWTFGTSPPPQDLTIISAFTEQSGGQTISPGAVWLDVTGWTGWDSPGPSGDGLYDSRLCEIEYYWDITGPEGAVFAARDGVNLPSSPGVFRDCSKQRGPRVCFPLTAPGAYNWTCFAVEPSSGKTCIKTGSFTTVSEDSAFPTTRTICYSIDGTFTGAPSGAQQITTLAAMQTAISSAITAGDPFRILLRRGETYAGSNINFTWTSAFPNFRSGTYGTGADPVVEAPFVTPLFTFPSGGGSKQVWVGPIWWKGRWNQVNERGYIDTVRIANVVLGAGTLAHYGVRITGMNADGFDYPTGDNFRFAQINCDASDYRMAALGPLTPTGDRVNRSVAFIGGYYGDIPGCVDGITGRTGAGQWQASLANSAAGAGWCIRLGDVTTAIFQHCSLSSQQGSQENFHQGALRMNTAAVPGAIYSIAFTAFEGAVDNQNSVSDRQAMNLTMDACMFFPTGHTAIGGALRLIQTGCIVRNCMFWVGGFTILSNGSTGAAAVFAGLDTDGGPTNRPYPIKAYNNTYYAKNGLPYFERLSMASGGYADLVFENNIKSDGNDPNVMEEAMLGFTPRFLGRKLGFPTIPITLSGTWNQTETFDILFSNALLNEQDGTPTTESYWNATVAAGDTFHMIRLANATILYADAGDFSMAVLSDRLRFTNVAAGNIAAQSIHVKVDRASELPTPDGALAVNAAGTVAWPVIATGSEATFEISTGLRSYRDLENTVRGTPAYRGAIEA
jgi:hypothetical protein